MLKGTPMVVGVGASLAAALAAGCVVCACCCRRRRADPMFSRRPIEPRAASSAIELKISGSHRPAPPLSEPPMLGPFDDDMYTGGDMEDVEDPHMSEPFDEPFDDAFDEPSVTAGRRRRTPKRPPMVGRRSSELVRNGLQALTGKAPRATMYDAVGLEERIVSNTLVE